MVLNEDHVLRAMEQELAGRFIPVKQKLNAGLSENSRVKSGEEFLKIREMVYRNIQEMAENVTRGHIAPCPVRGGKVKDPCSYCDFRRLCNNAGGGVFREILTGEETEKGGEEL